MKILKLTLWGIIFLCSNSSLSAQFEVIVNQEIINTECNANISISVQGNAGPFDIYLYSSENSVAPLEEHLNIDSETIDFETIIINQNYQNSPVIKVYDDLGCEWVYDEILLNCDCELVKIDTYDFDNGTSIEQLPTYIHINHPSSCFSDNGSIKLQPRGPMSNGTSPFTYEWSDPSIVMGTYKHSNFTPGIYTLTITDANGCSDAIEIQMKAENGPKIIYSETCPTCEGQSSGQVTVHATTGGGVQDDGTYSDIELIWDFEIDDESTVEDDSSTSPHAGTTTIRNLEAGEYCLTIREHLITYEGVNIGFCDNVQCFTIESLLPAAELDINQAATLSSINNSCPFQSTGSISISAFGGIKFNEIDCGNNHSDYKFEWSDGEITFDNYRGPATEDKAEFKPLAGGLYSVTVEDYCGDTEVIDFEIPVFEEITMDITPLIECHCEGELNLSNISGGEGDFIFLNITGPDNYNKNIEINKLSGDNDRTLTGLCAGNYIVHAEDEEECTQTFPAVEVQNYPKMELSLSVSQQPCILNTSALVPHFENGHVENFGSANLSVTWSYGPPLNATYQWSNGSTNQDLTNIGSSEFPEGTNSKIYSVTVTDENGCDDIASIILENTMRAEKIPPSETNGECECGFILICDGSESEREVVQEYKNCNVLSEFTGEPADCFTFSCFCEYPFDYFDVEPEGTDYSLFPLDCEDEEDLPKNTMCIESECQHEVICPNWDFKVWDGIQVNSVYSNQVNLENFECVLNATPNTSSIINSSSSCGSSVTVSLEVSLNYTEGYDECDIAVTATSFLNGNIVNTITLNPIQNHTTHSFTIDQFSLLLPDPASGLSGVQDCNAELSILFELNGNASEWLDLNYHFSNCNHFQITNIEDGDCGDKIFHYQVPCLNGTLCGFSSDNIVGCDINNFADPDTCFFVPSFNNTLTFGFDVNNLNGLTAIDQTSLMYHEGSIFCHDFQSFNLCDDNSCEDILDSLGLSCQTANLTDPEGCESDLAASNNNDYEYISFSNQVQGPKPAVITSPLSYNDNDPGTVRLNNITNAGFEMKIHEWDYLNGEHSVEQISYLSASPGIYDFGGLKAEIGFLDNVNHQFKTFELNGNFDEPPVIITALVSDNDPKPVARRVRNITANTFQLKLQEEVGNNPSFQHGNETVAFIAIEIGQGVINGKTVLVDTTGQNVNHNWSTVNVPGYFSSTPLIFAEMQTTTGGDLATVRYKNLTENAFEIQVEEEQSSDEEVLHAIENIGYILVASDKLCKCDDTEISLLDSQVFNSTCGLYNGFIEVQPEGGLPDYTFSWSNGETTSNIYNLEGGEYGLTVTDANGCTIEDFFTVESLDGLEMKYVTFDHPSCIADNGWIQAETLGGELPYSYLWNTGATTESIENLGPGTYSVTVTDDNGCTGEYEIELSYLDLNQEYVKNDPVCGLDNGSIVGDAYGGAAPYTYQWEDGSTTSERHLLAPDTYHLTVTDSDGCTETKQFNLVNDNSIDMNASGGDEGFHDGKFLEAGVDLNWYFRPLTVADQLIIESSVDGVLLNTGKVTRKSYCGCDAGSTCQCADLFLGDHGDQTIPLIVGSGLVDTPSSINCANSSTPKESNGIGGTINIPSDGYITVTVNGNSCGSGNTFWYVTLTCESVNRNGWNEDDYPIKDDVKEIVSHTDRINIYPNPLRDYLNIVIREEFETAEYSIFGLEGRQVKGLRPIDKELSQINLSELVNGIYILKVMIDGNTYIKKIIKQD